MIRDEYDFGFLEIVPFVRNEHVRRIQTADVDEYQQPMFVPFQQQQAPEPNRNTEMIRFTGTREQNVPGIRVENPQNWFPFRVGTGDQIYYLMPRNPATNVANTRHIANGMTHANLQVF